MINEMTDVKRYLEGQGLSHDIEYRICLLLAKWYYQNGATTRDEIRERLKAWAKENSFYFTVSMNTVADRVISGQMKLLGGEPVYINEADKLIIVDKFDTYEERIVALAILCYAKTHSDRYGHFQLSQASLGKWLKMERKTIAKHIDQMVGSNFMAVVETGSVNSWYQSMVAVGCSIYELCFETINNGEWQLRDNDLHKLYDTMFVEGDWHDIPGFNGWYMISDDRQIRAKERRSCGKTYSSKILWPTTLPHGRTYINLRNEEGKQKRCSIEKLYRMSV